MFFLNAFRVVGMRVVGWKAFLDPMGSKQRAVFFACMVSDIVLWVGAFISLVYLPPFSGIMVLVVVATVTCGLELLAWSHLMKGASYGTE